jgi:glutamate/aspartate transport system substrate-binding protein
MSYPMLESGRAIAFMQGDALLAGEVAKAKKPEDCATGTPVIQRILWLYNASGGSASQKSRG